MVTKEETWLGGINQQLGMNTHTTMYRTHSWWEAAVDSKLSPEAYR